MSNSMDSQKERQIYQLNKRETVSDFNGKVMEGFTGFF